MSLQGKAYGPISIWIICNLSFWMPLYLKYHGSCHQINLLFGTRLHVKLLDNENDSYHKRNTFSDYDQASTHLRAFVRSPPACGAAAKRQRKASVLQILRKWNFPAVRRPTRFPVDGAERSGTTPTHPEGTAIIRGIAAAGTFPLASTGRSGFRSTSKFASAALPPSIRRQIQYGKA